MLDRIEVSSPVYETIASWRRIIEGRQDGVDARGLLRRAATDLWQVLEIDRTVHPETHAVARQEAVDALGTMAEGAGVGPDDAQFILAEAFKQQTPPALSEKPAESANGQAADEPPPPSGPADYGLPPDEAAPASPDESKGQQRPRRFPLLSFDRIEVDTARRDYLVKGLLASTGLAVVWGPPKCGKSFWAMDVGLHISLGWEYRGRRVQQASVVYVALEGQHGMAARIEAFRRHHKVNAAPFFLVMVRLNLIADAPALVADIKAQIGDVMPGAVFIDTLNRSLVGSESKDEDMARYLAAADMLADRLGCAVIVIHHCGIDASRPRGHTSLTGSVESQLAVKRGDTGEVIVTVEYAKDFAEGIEVYSRLDPVMVGTDPDGDDITTLVVTPAESATPAARGPKVKGANKVALNLLRKAIDEAGTIAPASNHIPPDKRTISVQTWRTYADQGTLTESDKPDNQRRVFVRAVAKLQQAGLIGVWGGQAWII